MAFRSKPTDEDASTPSPSFHVEDSKASGAASGFATPTHPAQTNPSYATGATGQTRSASPAPPQSTQTFTPEDNRASSTVASELTPQFDPTRGNEQRILTLSDDERERIRTEERERVWSAERERLRNEERDRIRAEEHDRMIATRSSVQPTDSTGAQDAQSKKQESLSVEDRLARLERHLKAQGAPFE